LEAHRRRQRGRRQGEFEMSVCVEVDLVVEILPEKMPLWVVWIDTNLGCLADGPDWEMNSEPQQLKHALAEASQLRADGWPSKILPERQTPRSDGYFYNPAHR
jgi:hypothetical protein